MLLCNGSGFHTVNMKMNIFGVFINMIFRASKSGHLAWSPGVSYGYLLSSWSSMQLLNNVYGKLWSKPKSASLAVISPSVSLWLFSLMSCGVVWQNSGCFEPPTLPFYSISCYCWVSSWLQPHRSLTSTCWIIQTRAHSSLTLLQSRCCLF